MSSDGTQSGSSTAEQGAPEAVRGLEARLEAKEQLVKALTERLEQAAEQLDRYERSGAERKRTPSGSAAVPADILEQQKSLTADLQQAVELWNDMQAPMTLSRIEHQLGELREMLESGSQGGGDGLDDFLAASLGGAKTADDERPAQDEPPAGPPEEEAGEKEEQSWEALKAEILGTQQALTRDADPDAAPTETASDDLPAEDESGSPDHSAVDPPAAIDVDSASREELVQAIEDRDAYNAHLLQKLRHHAGKPSLPTDWAALEHAPEELCERLRALERELEERLRMAEVEHSMERARIGRDQMRLEQQQQQIEKQLQQLGLANPSDASGKADASERRWLRYLGVKRNE